MARKRDCSSCQWARVSLCRGSRTLVRMSLDDKGYATDGLCADCRNVKNAMEMEARGWVVTNADYLVLETAEVPYELRSVTPRFSKAYCPRWVSDLAHCCHLAGRDVLRTVGMLRTVNRDPKRIAIVAFLLQENGYMSDHFERWEAEDATVMRAAAVNGLKL